LPYHREQVRLVELLQLGVEPARWPKVGKPESTTRVLDAAAQYVEDTSPGHLTRQAGQKALFHLSAVVLFELLPFPGLGSIDEVEHVAWKQAAFAVVFLGVAPKIAA
jgi:hypothetical protein